MLTGGVIRELPAVAQVKDGSHELIVQHVEGVSKLSKISSEH